MNSIKTPNGKHSFSFQEILADYRLANRSRFASLLARKEVLTGKASFGILGDGVELPQIALSKAFQNGDLRSGYYRDQTIEMAIGNLTVEQFFSQLYADPDIKNEPHSGGRQMNSHFASRILDEKGRFKNLLGSKVSISDISPTGGQMDRLLGLAYASKIYRGEKTLKGKGGNFSRQGNEVVFGSIGDASTSEGHFFEVMNAAGVLQVPLLMSIWDNRFGISVPTELQTVRNSISTALSGFQSEEPGQGIYIRQVRAWDYLELCETYLDIAEKVRKEHKPALIHVIDVTQPQGHSTSGSHERYKTKERLEWEKDNCCIRKFREFILANKIASTSELDKIEEEEKKFVAQAKTESWDIFTQPLRAERTEILSHMHATLDHTQNAPAIQKIIASLEHTPSLYRRVLQASLFKAVLALKNESFPAKDNLFTYYKKFKKKYTSLYESKLYSDSEDSPLHVKEIKPVYSAKSEVVDGRVVLQRFFAQHLERHPEFFIIGEDVGKLGDVNLVFEGLNARFGNLRVTDTGIRESSILGQGLGSAVRGLRPLVDIQYLDYFLYALQTASDDLATLHYRTAGGQKSPVIIRSKGHRLEGIWHTGSPLSVLLGALRGVFICVPRNMTQAAGMYNALLNSDNPALVIEVLNGYRLKEKVPDNLGEYTVPLGVPEVLRYGNNMTIVTYGACCKVALEAAEELEAYGISVEIIDVQTLLPFDRSNMILQSIQKTHAVLFLDEDVPGGASAYMMQQVLEKNKAFDFLNCTPRTLTAKENRGAYGRDGDYYCKPQVEDVFAICYRMMKECEPEKYPDIFEV